MRRIRRFEAKCVELYQAQKIRGFLHLCDGEEAVSVGVTAESGTAEIIAGRPAEEIHAEIDRVRPDLVVMGTHGRRGLSRVMLGSDAEYVVRRVTVPVLLVPRPAATAPGQPDR